MICWYCDNELTMIESIDEVEGTRFVWFWQPESDYNKTLANPKDYHYYICFACEVMYSIDSLEVFNENTKKEVDGFFEKIIKGVEK